MTVLLFHPDKATLEMMSFCLESQMGLTVHRALSFQQAIELFLEEDVIDLVVTSQQAETDKFFKYLLTTNSAMPVVLVTETESEKIETYPDLNIIDTVSRKDVPARLFTVIREKFRDAHVLDVHQDYTRISTELLVRVVPLRGNVYIRLSSAKYVKLFRTGMVFTQEDLERFLVKKKVAYLYIEKSDTEEFVGKFKSDLAATIENAKAGDNSLLNTVGEVQSLLQELSMRLGFTKDVQEMAHQNIQLAIKAIGASPRLSKVLATSQMSSRNYISSHSVLLANVACSIAAKMKWPSNTTFQKLVMAALFHDFTFTDPELARIHELPADHNHEHYNLIKSHPAKASELIKAMHEIAGDVDVIVAQHHERPDGSGFPRGLRAHQIAPLAAVLIVAHDLIDENFREGRNFDLARFLARTEPLYSNSSFKKVWQSMHVNTRDQRDTDAA